ncbi:unnamed protein product, partial [Staurois parvus]
MLPPVHIYAAGRPWCLCRSKPHHPHREMGTRRRDISSNGTPPALGNATVLGTSAAFSKEVQGLLPCVSRTRESIQMNGLSCPCKMRPTRPH